MHLFVTGAAGFIGRAVTSELISHGHTVTGLSRSDANAEKLRSLGAQVHQGTLDDPETLKAGAAASDGVVHLAFEHDFTAYERVCAGDRAAISTLAEGLAASKGGAKGKLLIIASGTLLAPHGVLTTEDTEPKGAPPPFSERAKSANLVEELSKTQGIRGIVMRLPPTVHDKEDRGLIPMYIETVKKNGVVTYPGEKDGKGVWPACHRADVAVLLRLLAEKGEAGRTYHAVAEQGVRTWEVAELIGKKLGIEVEAAAPQEAGTKIGFFAGALSIDNPTSSEKTQRELGWTSKGLRLLDDMEKNYFG